MPQTLRPAGWQQFIARFPEARLLWDVTDVVVGTLRGYALHGKVVIVHEYAGDNGWTVYVDPFTTLDIEETFKAIEKHCS